MYEYEDELECTDCACEHMHTWTPLPRFLRICRAYVYQLKRDALKTKRAWPKPR